MISSCPPLDTVCVQVHDGLGCRPGTGSPDPHVQGDRDGTSTAVAPGCPWAEDSRVRGDGMRRCELCGELADNGEDTVFGWWCRACKPLPIPCSDAPPAPITGDR